jgi:hypothetical protein
MTSVWGVTSPGSAAKSQLESGKMTTMKELLKELRDVIPEFQNIASTCDDGTFGNPKSPTFSIKDAKEKAYQRAYHSQDSTEIIGTLEGNGRIHVTWLDIEVPVVPGTKARRPSLDMIGQVAGVPSLIVELKAAGGTSPFHAIQEVLSYAHRVVENQGQLKSHKTWRKGAQEIPIPPYWPHYQGKYLVIAGPNDYWAKWKSEWDLILAVGTMWFAKSGLQGYRLILASFPGVDFKKQRGASERYTPRIKDNRWTVMYEVHIPGGP